MDSIKITFLRTYEEALKARILYETTSKESKRYKILRILSNSVIVYLIWIAWVNPFKDSYFYVGEKSFPVIGIIFSISYLIPPSILVGWGIYELQKISRQTEIKKYLRSFPPESFGPISITINQSGVIVQAPLVQCEYAWKAVSSLIFAPDYIFFCGGSALIISVPVHALGSQEAEFIAKAKKWISTNP